MITWQGPALGVGIYCIRAQPCMLPLRSTPSNPRNKAEVRPQASDAMPDYTEAAGETHWMPLATKMH